MSASASHKGKFCNRTAAEESQGSGSVSLCGSVSPDSTQHADRVAAENATNVRVRVAPADKTFGQIEYAFRMVESRDRDVTGLVDVIAVTLEVRL